MVSDQVVIPLDFKFVEKPTDAGDRRPEIFGQLTDSQISEPGLIDLARVKERAASYDAPRLQNAARHYGNVRTKKFFAEALKADMASHVR